MTEWLFEFLGQLNQQMEKINERLELIEGVVELCIGLPTTILAIYSTYKLRLLVTFPPTTRIVLGASTSSIAVMTLLHSILSVIPESYYSVQHGHYISALFVYTLQFVCLACTVLLDLKLALLGWESYLAFNNRHDYEYRDGSQGWKLVAYYVGFAIVVSWIKVVWYVFFTEMPLDTRLHFAFFIEDSMPFVSFQYFLGFVSIAFGLTQIYRIHRFAKRMKYKSQSLTESFQIKQIVTLLGILKPLALSFMIGYAFALFFHICACVMLSRGYFRLYRNLAAAVFAVGGLYNTFALMFMLYKLPQLRQLMIRDVVSVCRLHKHRIAHSNTRENVVDRIENLDDHFNALKKIWDH
ncbi:hypothetical protein M3Y95_00317400 [Aphelenchoides besseyi]|nr:hypothetical protein M3Y95_00317400 [Aphelenchoides besseyi]